MRASAFGPRYALVEWPNGDGRAKLAAVERNA
jgi:hypothetical protein